MAGARGAEGTAAALQGPYTISRLIPLSEAELPCPAEASERCPMGGRGTKVCDTPVTPSRFQLQGLAGREQKQRAFAEPWRGEEINIKRGKEN